MTEALGRLKNAFADRYTVEGCWVVAERRRCTSLSTLCEFYSQIP
jgi:hypothetical protein